MDKENETHEVDITEVVSSLKKSSDTTAKLCEVISMGFDDIKKTWVPKLAEVAKPPADKAPDAANLEEARAGILGKAGNVSVGGVKIVPLAVGAFGAIFASELIDGFMSQQSKMIKALVKGVGAFAVMKWGKKIPLVGAEGAKIIALLLAFDAIRDITPIDAWASAAANKVSGMIPIGGLGDQTGRAKRALGDVRSINRDYYAHAFGRS